MRPIGQNRGCSFPIAEAFIAVEAANLMRFKRASFLISILIVEHRLICEKHLAAKPAGEEAANACLQFHGGYGFACGMISNESLETRFISGLTISTNLI